MGYPSLEQYNEAFQLPRATLTDTELKQGTVATTGLGLPLALCGGFALTYTVKTPSKKYAVRCFHKQSNALEKRYESISNRLVALRSTYFVDFEFQSQGIRVGGSTYPIVKMSWATGTTLGEFLEQNYRNASAIRQLSLSLRELAKYLKTQGIAHGDIQPGNVMVADSGRRVQLIDYDGIFLDDLKSLGSAELGHRNFQHPKRTGSTWDGTLDRFSFISLDLALRALEISPELWRKTYSDGDSILFKANDFADPSGSAIFAELFQKPQIADDAKNFASVCLAAFDKTPSLEDFLARKGVPQIVVSASKAATTKPTLYLSAFPVVDATKYSQCLQYVGDKVELIGQIVEVKEDKTRHGKPYIFINFGPWKGHIVKISIWSEGLAAIAEKPSQGWVGKWISVVGLMEPPYISKRYKYSHLAISITQGSQLHLITDSEARFRLAGSATRAANNESRNNNREILDGLKSGKSISASSTSPKPKMQPPTTGNQAILQRMRASQPSVQATPQSYARPTATTRSTPSQHSSTAPKANKNCFIATAIYGTDAPQTNALRKWRDTRLLTNRLGRAVVVSYYKIAPMLVPVLQRSPKLRELIRSLLDKLLRHIG